MSKLNWQKRLVPQSGLLKLGDQLRASNKKIVFTAGSWDLIHAGQCRYLEKAAEYGDALVVGVSSNSAIKHVKGPNKPILDEKVRAEMLTYLKSVAFVTILPEPSCQPSIALLRPDVYITVQEDWTTDFENSNEYKTVLGYGGRPLLVQRQSSQISTTQILQRAIGGHLSDTLKDYMQYRKDPIKEK